MEEITASWVRGSLPRRDPMGPKGTFGKVLCWPLYTSDAADE